MAEVSYRTPKGGGFPLDYNMAIHKFTKIREIGLSSPVRLCIPGRPLCRFTRESHSRQCSHWSGIRLRSAPRLITARSDHSNQARTAEPFQVPVYTGTSTLTRPKSAASARLKPAVSRAGTL